MKKTIQSSGQYFDNDMGAFGQMQPAGRDDQAIQELITTTKDLLSL